MSRATPLLRSQLGYFCICLILAGCVTHPKAAQDNTCQVAYPPTGSIVRSTHAGNLITFPPSINTSFNGCQKTWLEDGHLLATVGFIAGKISFIEIIEPEGPSISCKYDDKQLLTTGDQEICRAYAQRTLNSAR